jgi:hypothetical protein
VHVVNAKKLWRRSVRPQMIGEMTWLDGGRLVASAAIALAACSPEDTGTLPGPGSDEGGLPADNGDAGGGGSSGSVSGSSNGSGSGVVTGSSSGASGGSGSGSIPGSDGGGSGSGSSSGSAGGSSSGGASGSSSGSGSSGGSGGADGGRDAGVGSGMDAGGSMETAAPTVLFTTSIAPIVNPTCRDACHGGCGGLTIAYANIVNVKSGEVPSINYVTPNDPGHSYLWCKVNPTDTDCVNARTVIMGVRMPADGPPYLSASNLNLIKMWIQQAASN